ncbi:MAG: HAMP domain-containing histidine kinase [Candidatus Eremiobacteraeota bacterium]|nr:HAMP domain-containing histidine kinase [Candidatus Eremiobacteraeota bacterium]MBV9972096.1 HAMP domain-containing histidine kinase [Candidatus Eremiobacteraeota bacterium]
MIGIVITARFQSILYEQTRSRIDRTMQDIARIANPSSNPFLNIGESAPIEQTLANSDNLERWSSPTTFLQIDNAQGYPMGKSSNLGDMSFPPAKDLNAKHDTAYRSVRLARGEFLVEDRLFTQGSRQFVVHVGEPLDQLNETFARTRETIATIIGLAIFAVVILSIALAGRATRPLGELTTAMREIGSDRLNRRLKWSGRDDEIGTLAQTFDEMLARLEEAFARERRFIADASHELKTPLTSINANAQMLRRWGSTDEGVRTESLEMIAQETAALANMVNGMLTLAKAESAENLPKEPVSLKRAAQEATSGAQPRAGEKGLDLELHADGDPIVLGDASLLRQMISNLIDNAIKFTERGRVDVFVGSDGAQCLVEVCDTGPGIDTGEVPHIFDRFYRADKSRDRSVPGTGLGLAIVRSIVRAHGGSVSADSAGGGGTRIRVRLPLATA